MENRRNYYRILHIQQDAPAAIIKASYQAQMQKLRMHPDLGGDEWNAAILNEAYQVLSDPVKRKEYDRTYSAKASGKKDSSRNEQPRPSANQSSTTPGQDRSVCAFCRTARPAQAPECGPQDCPGCGGPTTAVRILRIVDDSQRYIERIARQEGIMVFPSPGAAGMLAALLDLSPAGLQLQLSEPLAAGSIIRLSSTSVRAIASVRYCNRSMNGRAFVAGVEFLTACFPQRSGTFLSTRA